RPRQLHQRVVHVDDLIKPRAEQILLAGLPSLAWSHRKSPLHQPEREESRLAIRGNPQNRICKKIALQRPKTGKFDYLSEPNHPAHSMAFKFFTDDDFVREMFKKGAERQITTFRDEYEKMSLESRPSEATYEDPAFSDHKEAFRSITESGCVDVYDSELWLPPYSEGYYVTLGHNKATKIRINYTIQP